jgi:hypothetical protein
VAQVNDPAPVKRSTVYNANDDRLPIAFVGHLDPCAKRKGLVSGSESVGADYPHRSRCARRHRTRRRLFRPEVDLLQRSTKQKPVKLSLPWMIGKVPAAPPDKDLT